MPPVVTFAHHWGVSDENSPPSVPGTGHPVRRRLRLSRQNNHDSCRTPTAEPTAPPTKTPTPTAAPTAVPAKPGADQFGHSNRRRPPRLPLRPRPVQYRLPCRRPHPRQRRSQLRSLLQPQPRSQRRPSHPRQPPLLFQPPLRRRHPSRPHALQPRHGQRGHQRLSLLRWGNGIHGKRFRNVGMSRTKTERPE